MKVGSFRECMCVYVIFHLHDLIANKGNKQTFQKKRLYMRITNYNRMNKTVLCIIQVFLKTVIYNKIKLHSFSFVLKYFIHRNIITFKPSKHERKKSVK